MRKEQDLEAQSLDSVSSLDSSVSKIYEKSPKTAEINSINGSGLETESDSSSNEYQPIKKNEDNLKRSLSAAQVNLIAIGGTIGTGLFLGSGKALANGGPASILICYAIVGGIIYVTMQSLGEMATLIPIAGSFNTFASRFVDEALGFSMSWNYAFNDMVSVASDLVAAQLIIDYWNKSFPWYAVSLIIWAFVVIVNFISVKWYGRLEYTLSLLKVVTIIIFIIIGIVVNCGGNVNNEYIGGKFWHIEGAPFHNGIGGFAKVFVTASFAYGGTESIAITAGETKNPTKTMPRVVKNVFYRILLFYVLSMLIIGLNVPWNYPNLSTKKTTTSPFTIVFTMVGSNVAGSFINAVVFTSVISACNHAFYAGTRVLYAIGEQKHGPKFITYLTPQGVPWVCIIIYAILSGLLFGASFVGAGQLWTWLQNIVGVSNQLSWICINLTSLRFRAGLKAQGMEHILTFKNWTYPYGPLIGLILSIFIVLIQGWDCFKPFNVVDFVSYYLEIPIFVVMIFAWKLIKRTKFVKVSEMDFVTDVYIEEKIQHDEIDIDSKDFKKKNWFKKFRLAMEYVF